MVLAEMEFRDMLTKLIGKDGNKEIFLGQTEKILVELGWSGNPRQAAQLILDKALGSAVLSGVA